MTLRKLLPLTGLMLVCSLTFAHEFWLEPVKFWLAKKEKVRIDLRVGEDYTGGQMDDQYPAHDTKHRSKTGRLAELLG